MRLPQILTNADEFLIRAKDDDDVMMGREGLDYKLKANQVNATIDWDSVLKVFKQVPKENLGEKINEIVLQTKSSINENVLKRYIDNTSREGFIKSTMVELMSTPEYQMC
jgi:hypothetical protein